jgi:uncharacterized repeat protein (TIGR02543 family)/LPXTG-motif cell wall-anchored protein
MKSLLLRVRTRSFLGVFLSFLLVFSLYTPVWAYADEEIAGEASSEQEEETSLNDVIDDEIDGVALLIDSILPQALSSAISPKADVSSRAVGNLFLANIDLTSSGSTTSILCIFMVTNADPANLQVQIGDGSSNAISQGTSGAIKIPDTISYGAETYKVTSIGDSAFNNCPLLTDTGLGNNQTVVSIGNYAFDGCFALTNTGLTTNASVTSIGNFAFDECLALTNTGLANSAVTSIGNYAFYGCTSLTDTGLGSSTVVSMGDSAFEECFALTSTGLETNSTITSIGNQVFCECTSLTSTGLATNQTITSIGNFAFDECLSLCDTGLGTNSTVTSIGYGAFGACAALTDTGLATNTTVTSIGDMAFGLCSLLGTVGTSSTNQGDLVLNSSVTTVGYGAFGGTAYTRIYLLASTSSGVAVGNYAFSFSGGKGTLFVPESWDTGSSPITFSDGQYTYSTNDGSLVVMYESAAVDITVGSVSRVPGTSDQATVVFETDTDKDIAIKDTLGATLWSGLALAGVPVSTAPPLTVQSSAAISGLTIATSTYSSLTYPAGVQVQVYNTVSGTEAETFSIPATTYSIVFDGNGADNSDAMLTDTMSLTYDQSTTLVSNAYTREGYTFEGWNTLAGGTDASYANEASVINLTGVEGGVVTLYAQWTEVSTPGTTDDNATTEEDTSAATATAAQSSGTTSTTLPQTADSSFPWSLLMMGAILSGAVSLIALKKRVHES